VPKPSFSGVTVVDHPLIRVKLSILREEKTSTREFRRELHELAGLMTFEVTRNFRTVECQIVTPLGVCTGFTLARPVIVAPILRAGLGMVEGILDVLSDVTVGHIGMFRDEETLRPQSYYFKLPAHLAIADVLVVDPMLATGWSATAAVDKLKRSGAKYLHYVCLVSCPEGITQLHQAHPDVPIFTAAIDDGLNEKGYILPGLGDAGDRYFGTFIEVT
jgi:uracil phosphoribosyltransferase